MNFTTELNKDILNYVESLNVICGINDDGVITLDRTSMMNCKVCENFSREDDCYHMILELIKEKFNDGKYWMTYAGKTDDVYFLTIYIR
jgi:hypothetical protein